jgi:uncharacterized membrane protein YvbJ
MKCRNCGTENAEGQKFCGDCGEAIRKEMTKINSFNRAIVILASGVIPVGFGVLIGLFYTLRPDRKNDYLGPLCIILGFANSAIVWYITSLM